MSIQAQRKIALVTLNNDLENIKRTLDDLLLLPKTMVWNIVVFRFLLPEIESLGKYFQGEYKPNVNAVSFIKEYFTKIDPLYFERGSFLWATYRHGVIHNGNHLNIFTYKGKSVGPGYGFNSEKHLELITGETFSFYVSTERLIRDTIKAFELYIEDLKVKDHLVQNYTHGFWIRVQGENKIDDGSDMLNLEKYISGKNSSWISSDDIRFIVNEI